MSEDQNQGLTRREMLRRGVVTGGAALAWASPVVTTIGLDRAFATVTSPGQCTPAISYVAIHFTCGTSGTIYYSKFDGSWDGGAGQVAEQCGGFDTSNGADAGQFGFSFSFATGILTVPGSCTVIDIAVFGGNQCAVSSGVNV
ncbi:MAG: hypothetical protein WD354_02115, partial [Acidimicrobiia bacterium]